MIAMEHQTVEVYLVRPCWNAWHDDPRGIAPIGWVDGLHDMYVTIDQITFCVVWGSQLQGV